MLKKVDVLKDLDLLLSRELLLQLIRRSFFLNKSQPFIKTHRFTSRVSFFLFLFFVVLCPSVRHSSHLVFYFACNLQVSSSQLANIPFQHWFSDDGKTIKSDQNYMQMQNFQKILRSENFKNYLIENYEDIR